MRPNNNKRAVLKARINKKDQTFEYSKEIMAIFDVGIDSKRLWQL